MIAVEINGTPVRVEPGTSLHALIEQQAGTTRGCAVVVDGTVVPRSQWPTYEVPDDVHIELIKAVQGG